MSCAPKTYSNFLASAGENACFEFDLANNPNVLHGAQELIDMVHGIGECIIRECESDNTDHNVVRKAVMGMTLLADIVSCLRRHAKFVDVEHESGSRS